MLGTGRGSPLAGTKLGTDSLLGLNDRANNALVSGVTRFLLQQFRPNDVIKFVEPCASLLPFIDGALTALQF